MYFPKRFDRKLAMESGNLIIQAYEQFSAFESGNHWKLSGNCRFLQELSYNWKPGQKIDEPSLESDPPSKPKLFDLKKAKSVQLPIGFIAERKQTLYIIFRGTLTTQEWMRNISFNLKDYLLPDYGKVHEGFIQIYKLTRDGLLTALSRQKKNTKIIIAGHSLGGALATLAAPDIEASTGLKIGAIYTFGSPRVGDDSFVKAYNRAYSEKTFRIANTSDIVTSIPLPVPFGILAGGYFSHVDTPVDCTLQGNDIEINHKMESYLSLLEAAGKGEGFLKQLFSRWFPSEKPQTLNAG